jgi:hypothetical protein
MKKEVEPPSKERNPYLEYPGSPIVIGNFKDAIEAGKVTPLGDNIRLELPSGEPIVIPKKHQFNRVSQTLQELTEVIHEGSLLCREFDEDVLSRNGGSPYHNMIMHGNIVYYPEKEDVVFYASPKWHKNALILRNSLLIRDPNQEISWRDQRKVFDSLVIGVAGASVGKNAFMRIVDTMRPGWMKIADPKTYKDTNGNRASLAYWEVGKNKAIVTAQQAHRNDPYINISVYPDGLTDLNMNDFVNGNEAKGEPALNYLIEETDDPNRKIESLKWAKRHKIPFGMVTDIGTAYQIDFRDFKKTPDLPLMRGIEDEEILAIQQRWQAGKGNAALLLNFGMKLTGDNWKDVPEFRDLIMGKYQGTSREIPQLGVAANAGGSHLAVTLAKHALGAVIPERFFVNLASRRIIEE